jgi:hypothetical protein
MKPWSPRQLAVIVAAQTLAAEQRRRWWRRRIPTMDFVPAARVVVGALVDRNLIVREYSDGGTDG